MDGKKRVLPFGLFRLGSHFEKLRSLLTSSAYIKDILPILEILQIYEIAEKFETIGKDAKNWHEFLSKQMSNSLVPDLATITEEQRRELQNMITRWSTLAEERMKGLYLITPSTHIAPEKLMGGLKDFLSEELVKLLIEQEQEDLKEACNCILIGSNTAAEFMSLRAAESLLRRWHKKKTGEILERKPWGFVLDKLTEAYPEKERPKEIKLLRYLKDRRDEIAHPERSSTSSEAECTLMNVFPLIQSLKGYL